LTRTAALVVNHHGLPKYRHKIIRVLVVVLRGKEMAFGYPYFVTTSLTFVNAAKRGALARFIRRVECLAIKVREA